MPLEGWLRSSHPLRSGAKTNHRDSSALALHRSIGAGTGKIEASRRRWRML